VLFLVELILSSGHQELHQCGLFPAFHLSCPLTMFFFFQRSVREATEEMCSFLHEICQSDEEHAELER